MVDFSKQEDVTQWLDAIEPETRRREVAVVIAARAALRVAPHLEQAVPRAKRERDAALSAIVLPVFRATALPWVAAVYPTHRNEISLRAPVENSLRAPVAATSAPVAATSAAAAAAATSAAAASRAAPTPPPSPPTSPPPPTPLGSMPAARRWIWQGRGFGSKARQHGQPMLGKRSNPPCSSHTRTGVYGPIGTKPASPAPPPMRRSKSQGR